MKYKNSLLGISIVLFFSLGGNSQQALAQSSSALEEVVVTASKRGEQLLQDTAGNIQVISGDTLDRLRIEGMEDYIKMVPGLETISSGVGQSDIVIRGINTGRVDENPRESTALAAVYVDDIPISMPGYTPDLGVLDIKQIEVLRGPQGTLYGKSAMSGIIRVLTKQPDVEQFFGKVKVNAAAVEDGEPNYGASGFFNIPLSDRLALNLNAFTSDKGGFIDNVDPVVGKDDYNSEQKYGGRAQLAYYGDDLTVTGTVFYDNLDADGRPDEFGRDPSDPRLVNITGERQITRFFEDYFKSEFVGGSLKFDWDVGDVVNVTSSTSYYESDIVTALDDTFRIREFVGLMERATGVDFQVTESLYGIEWKVSTLAHETRVASIYDSPVQWVVGVYYEDEERDFHEWQTGGGMNVALGLDPNEMVRGGIRGLNPANYLYQGWRTVPTEHLAVFGEVVFNITDNLELLIGLRWFDNERENFSFQQGYLFNRPESTLEVDEDGVIPKVQLTYNINDDVMVYASFAEGYRQGGTNAPASPALLCDDDYAAIGRLAGEGYESDSLFNYEVGTKTTWLDNRLTANATAYHVVWEDIQNPISLACGSTPTYNSGETETTGIEAELMFQATDALALRLGLAVTIDSEVTEGVLGVNVKGDTPPYVRDLMVSASADYRFPLWQGEGFARTDIRYVDASTTEFTSHPNITTLPSYTIVDLTLGYGFGDWDFVLGARNLFDDRVVTNIDPDRFQPNTFSLGQTRTVDFSISRRF